MSDNALNNAATLAAAFKAANDEFISFVEQCPDEIWRATCGTDTRTVAVVAHHVATAYPLVLGWVKTVTEGGQLPAVPFELIHRLNARHAEAHSLCTKEEVVSLLKLNGATAAEAVARLTDEQLARSAPVPWREGRVVTAAALIEESLIGHLRHHFKRVQNAGR